MKIRVAAPDVESARRLGEQIVGVDDAAVVQIDGAWAEVSVRPGAQTDRIVARVLRAVEHWLDESGADSATVYLGDRSHVMSRGNASARQAVVR